MQLSDSNDQLQAQLKDTQYTLEAEIKENKKLKEVMETMLKNRKIIEEEVQYYLFRSNILIRGIKRSCKTSNKNIKLNQNSMRNHIKN